MKKTIILILILSITQKVLAEDIKLADVPEFKLQDLEQIKVDYSLDRNPGEMGEKQTFLKKDQKALWDGVLLNPEAMALILSDRENLILKSNLALDTQRKSDLAKINLEVGKLRLELDSQKKKSVIEIQGRDSEIKSCQKINKQILNDRSDIKRKLFIGLGSGALGVVTGILLKLFLL